MSEEHKAVFLSYASQDADAARRICEALRAAGVEVWFDQSELRGGDAWDAKIRKQIKECALFVPVISANTQARLEGYFRLEWRLADQRSHLMAKGKPFLLPVAIDQVRDGDAHVPDSFLEVQWMRLRGGEGADGFARRVQELLEGGGASQTLPPSSPSGQSVPAPVRKRMWWPIAAVGLLALGAATIWRPWRSPGTTERPATAPLTETQQLIARITAIVEKDADASLEEWALAENLGAQAVKLEPANADAWAAHAQAALGQAIGFDAIYLAPFNTALKRAQQAVALAPNSLDAQLVLGRCFALDTKTRTEAEGILRALVERQPNDRRLWRTLANIRQLQEKHEEALTFYDRADAQPGGDPVACRQKATLLSGLDRYDEAEAALNRSLALRSGPATQLLLSKFLVQVRDDFSGAAAIVEKMPGSYRLREDIAEWAARLWRWKREPQRAIGALKAWNGNSIRSEPKGLPLGQAYHALGHAEAAQLAWRSALGEVERQIATAGAEGKPNLFYFKACLLACLGDQAAAEEARRTWLQIGQPTNVSKAKLFILLGRPKDAMSALPKTPWRGLGPFAATIGRLADQGADYRYDPIWDPLRGDPEFAALIAKSKRGASAPTNSAGGAPVAGADPKSVVVLPFENLSPDPENAIFTEGMHTEIISNLQLLSDLKVISRNAALAFKGSTASNSEIAQKLGVAHVITGSVRRDRDRVRIQLELRRASDDALLWSLPKGDYDLKDALGLQADIAEQVARVLQARQLQGGPQAVAQFMTKNPQAYDSYLKARRASDEGASPQESVAQYQAILALDPNFVSAACELAVSLARLGRTATDPAERLRLAAEAKRWAETGARLAPGGVGDVALAYYYMFMERNPIRGLALAENNIKALPNGAQGPNLAGIALAQLGRYAEAIASTRRAIDLDPLLPTAESNLAGYLTAMRRPEEAEQAMANAVAKGGVRSSVFAENRYQLFGEIPSPESTLGRTREWLWRGRRFTEALALIDAELRSAELDDVRRWLLLSSRSDVCARLGQMNEAATAAREALAAAERLQTVPEVGPAEKSIWLAWALVRNGRPGEGITAAKRYVEATSPQSQSWLRWNREITLARIYASANRPRECVDLLARLLQVPSGITVPMLRVEPDWDNVREDDGFKALLANPKNSTPL